MSFLQEKYMNYNSIVNPMFHVFSQNNVLLSAIYNIHELN